MRRHLWWKTSNFWRMMGVHFQVSQACRAVGMTMDVYRRSLVSRLMEWLDQILRTCWKVDAALPILARLSGNSLRQTVHTHWASVHQAAKLVAALLRVAGVTAGLAESNGSLPLGLWLTSPAGWLPRTGISSGTLRSVIKYGLPIPFFFYPIYQK